MTLTLRKNRLKAFNAQAGRCYYCGIPTWLDNPNAFAQTFGLRPAEVRQFRCTAEHLIPAGTGGSTAQNNIVAACHFCNQNRHRRKAALAPMQYKEHVRCRIEAGRWHTTSRLWRVTEQQVGEADIHFSASPLYAKAGA